MSILLIAPNKDMTPFKNALLNIDPNLDVEIWPEVVNKNRVNFSVVWNQPKNLLSHFPNLKVVSSLGAGADHLMQDGSISEEVIVTRLVAPTLKSQMCDYVETACYNILRRSESYFRQKLEAKWNVRPHYQKKDLRIGILGLGEIGLYTAKMLSGNGWPVSGWSRTPKTLEGVCTFSGEEEKDIFLNQTNIAVTLLPLTPKTAGILNLDLFKKMKSPAYLVNAARGEHLVEEDLIYALNSGILSGAFLDVFETEPLPDSHPFWNHSDISITPHVAALTDPEECAGQVVENYKRMLSGLKLLHTVDRKKGY